MNILKTCIAMLSCIIVVLSCDASNNDATSAAITAFAGNPSIDALKSILGNPLTKEVVTQDEVLAQNMWKSFDACVRKELSTIIADKKSGKISADEAISRIDSMNNGTVHVVYGSAVLAKSYGHAFEELFNYINDAKVSICQGDI